MRFFLMLCLSLFLTSPVGAKPVHIAFFGPSDYGAAYWDNVTTPLPHVAKDFNLNLTMHYANFLNKDEYHSKIKTLLESNNKPDYLISVFRVASARYLLELTEKHKVSLISISTGVPKFEQADIGLPRQHYKYWLAQILANDIDSGSLLVTELAKIAREKFSKNKLRLAAVGGDKTIAASVARDEGLRLGIKNDNNMDLLQLVHANWSFSTAKKMTSQLVSRYGNIDVIWAANDDVARGVYQHFVEDSVNYEDIPVIGGVDWTKKGLQAIKDEQLNLSLGGNHMHAIWALIMLHDISHGFDVTTPEQQTIFTDYQIADKENIDKIFSFVHQELWRYANYKQLSKVYNPKITSYDFDLNMLLQ